MKYEDQTKGDLQKVLRERGLATSGSKQTLIERLGGAEKDRLSSRRRDDLRAELRRRGLSVSGTKEELVERLVEADVGQEPAYRDGAGDARVEANADDATEAAEDSTEQAADQGEEVFDDVVSAAHRPVGSPSEHGVPDDRMLSAVRSAEQDGAARAEGGGQGGVVADQGGDAQNQDDRNILERLVAAFSAVVDQGGDAAGAAGGAAEEVAGRIRDAFGRAGSTADHAARQASDALGAAVHEVDHAADDVADATERLVDALRSRGISLEGDLHRFADRIVAAVEQTAGQLRSGGEDVAEPDEETVAVEFPIAARQSRWDEGDRADGDGVEGERMQLVRQAARQLEQLSGRRIDGVSGFRPDDDEWRITFELVEFSRVPPSTDLLGSYEVIVDGDGDLIRFQRMDRYLRGQAGEDVT